VAAMAVIQVAVAVEEGTEARCTCRTSATTMLPRSRCGGRRRAQAIGAETSVVTVDSCGMGRAVLPALPR
jgi:hypothetical protein